MARILSDIEFWTVMAPVLTVVVGWLLNERARRQAEREKRFLDQRARKESSYRILLENSKGFSVGEEEATRLKQAFLDELQICWLHASDEVIHKAYSFPEAVHTDAQDTEPGKEVAFANFVAALREDALSEQLVSKTRLSGRDYRLLKAT